MQSGDLVVVLISVGNHLALCAKRLVGRKEGRVAGFQNDGVKLTICRSLPVASIIEELAHLLYGNANERSLSHD